MINFYFKTMAVVWFMSMIGLALAKMLRPEEFELQDIKIYVITMAVCWIAGKDEVTK